MPQTRINVHLAKLYTQKITKATKKNVLWQYLYAGVWAKLYSYLGLTNLKLQMKSTRRIRLESAEVESISRSNCDHLLMFRLIPVDTNHWDSRLELRGLAYQNEMYLVDNHRLCNREYLRLGTTCFNQKVAVFLLVWAFSLQTNPNPFMPRAIRTPRK